MVCSDEDYGGSEEESMGDEDDGDQEVDAKCKSKYVRDIIESVRFLF